MSNYHLRDRNLSLKAKGLLSFMLSLPEDWDYSLAGLCAICKESRDAIRNVLKELQYHGYLKIEKVRGDKGYFEYNYVIFEKPMLEVDKNLNYPDTGKQYLDSPNVDNPTQINTNKQNDKDDKTISSFFIAEEHNILTIELINTGYIDELDTQIFYYDELFENLLEENNSYKELLKIIHYIVPRVKSRDFKDEEGDIIENKFGYMKNSIRFNIEKLNCKIDDLWI